MSWGFASSSLYVVCKDANQAKTLRRMFEQEKMKDGIFTLWTEKRDQLKIYIDLVNGEVLSTFDDEVLSMYHWLKDNFDLTLCGYWSFEGDGKWRSEVKEGEIIDASLDWLAEYSVEQIREIRQWAEKQYPTKIAF